MITETIELFALILGIFIAFKSLLGRKNFEKQLIEIISSKLFKYIGKAMIISILSVYLLLAFYLGSIKLMKSDILTGFMIFIILSAIGILNSFYLWKAAHR